MIANKLQQLAAGDEKVLLASNCGKDERIQKMNKGRVYLQ